MTPAARLSAAIEALADIETRRRPAADALKDWGLSHRFAGSGDRAAIATLVYDALRRRASSRWIMGADTPRATLLGSLYLARGLEVADIAALCSGERFAPEPLEDTERAALEAASLDGAPDAVRADVPDWLWPAFEAAFGAEAAQEGRALAGRAPLDLRTNTLKATRDKALRELGPLHAEPTALSPDGLRVPPGPDGRGASVQSEPAFLKGWFEVQDEGSQLATRLAAPPAGGQVLDLCAGGGGKTLALAALMGNRGQIFATDSDKRRLAPIHDRIQRAGVRNAQVRTPRGAPPVDDLEGRMDLVLVDAPCTGSGTWRRNPDAKWRLRPNSSADRQRDQAKALDTAAAAVKPGGRLAYVTCSVLPEENDAQLAAFRQRHSAFAPLDPGEVAEAAGLPAVAAHRSAGGAGLMLSPARTGTDGFFVAVLRRAAE